MLQSYDFFSTQQNKIVIIFKMDTEYRIQFLRGADTKKNNADGIDEKRWRQSMKETTAKLQIADGKYDTRSLVPPKVEPHAVC